MHIGNYLKVNEVMVIPVSGAHRSTFSTVDALEQIGLRHLVIVDMGVENWQKLYEGVSKGADSLVLHPQQGSGAK